MKSSGQCVRCRSEIKLSMPPRRNFPKPNQIENISNNPKNTSFNFIGVMIVTAVILLGTYFYLAHYSVDEVSKLSTFDQMYNNISPPSESDFKKCDFQK